MRGRCAGEICASTLGVAPSGRHVALHGTDAFLNEIRVLHVGVCGAGSLLLALGAEPSLQLLAALVGRREEAPDPPQSSDRLSSVSLSCLE